MLHVGRVEPKKRQLQYLRASLKLSVRLPFSIYIIYVYINKAGTFCTTFPLFDITWIPNFVRFINKKSPNKAVINRLLTKRPLFRKCKIIGKQKKIQRARLRAETPLAVECGLRRPVLISFPERSHTHSSWNAVEDTRISWRVCRGLCVCGNHRVHILL